MEDASSSSHNVPAASKVRESELESNVHTSELHQKCGRANIAPTVVGHFVPALTRQTLCGRTGAVRTFLFGKDRERLHKAAASMSPAPDQGHMRDLLVTCIAVYLQVT